MNSGPSYIEEKNRSQVPKRQRRRDLRRRDGERGRVYAVDTERRSLNATEGPSGRVISGEGSQLTGGAPIDQCYHRCRLLMWYRASCGRTVNCREMIPFLAIVNCRRPDVPAAMHCSIKGSRSPSVTLELPTVPRDR